MSGRGSWNKRATNPGVFDFHEERKKRFKHKGSSPQFYMNKSGGSVRFPPRPPGPVTTTATPTPSSGAPSSSSTPLAPKSTTPSPTPAPSCHPTVAAAAAMVAASASSSPASAPPPPPPNPTTFSSSSSSSSRSTSSASLSSSPYSTTLSSSSSTQQPSAAASSSPAVFSSTSNSASSNFGRPQMSSSSSPAASSVPTTPTNNTNNCNNSSMYHHHPLHHHHLPHPHHHQHHHHHPHQHHTGHATNAAASPVGPTGGLQQRMDNSGGTTAASSNPNCRRLPPNSGMTPSASTLLTSGVANMGLSNNNNNNTNKGLANTNMMMMSSGGGGVGGGAAATNSPSSAVSYHHMSGMRNDVLASRMQHNLSATSSSPVSMTPGGGGFGGSTVSPQAGYGGSSHSHHANATNMTGSGGMTNNNTGNNNNNITNHNFMAASGHNNNTVMTTTNSGAVMSATYTNDTKNNSTKVQPHHHRRSSSAATVGIYEFESSPPTSEANESPIHADSLDSQSHRKPIWSPVKTKGHDSSKSKDVLSDSEGNTKDRTMSTPIMEYSSENYRGRRTRAMRHDFNERRPVRRCSEFNETQLAFLESQWREGMVSVTRDSHKMIEETAECIGISPARVKRWIKDYGKANGVVVNEPVAKKRRLSVSSQKTPKVETQVDSELESSEISISKVSTPKKENKSKEKKTPLTTLTTTTTLMMTPMTISPAKSDVDESLSKREQIVGLLGKLSHTCSSLSSLGVETACLAVNKPVVFTLGSKHGTNFLKKEKQLQNRFLGYLAKGREQHKNNRKKLSDEVKTLFNEKFSECCGRARNLPFSKLEKDPMFIDIDGFPDVLVLKRPHSYGVSDLRKILNAADKIKFHLKSPEPSRKKANRQHPQIKKETTSSSDLTESSNQSPPTLSAQSKEMPTSKDLLPSNNVSGHTRSSNGSSPPPQLEPERPQLNMDNKSKAEPVPKFGKLETPFSTLPKAFHQTSGNGQGAKDAFLHSSYMSSSNVKSSDSHPNKHPLHTVTPPPPPPASTFGSSKPPLVSSSPSFVQHRTTFGSGSSRRKALEKARSEAKLLESKANKAAAAAEPFRPVDPSKTEFKPQTIDHKPQLAKFEHSQSLESPKYKPMDTLHFKPMETDKFKPVEGPKFKSAEGPKYKSVEASKLDKKSVESQKGDKKNTESLKSAKKAVDHDHHTKAVMKSVQSNADEKESDGKSDSQSEVFIVEKVLKKRVWKGQNEVLVKWKGYTNRYNSWEPMENIFTM